MPIDRMNNLLREADLAAYLGLTVGVFRRHRHQFHAAGLPAPLVSLGPVERGGRPLWSLRAIDRWLAQVESHPPAADALRDAAVDQLVHAQPGPCTTSDELAARAARLFDSGGDDEAA